MSSEARCPHCGAMVKDLWEYDLMDDGDSTDVECPHCDKPITVKMSVAVSYEIDARTSDGQ